MFSAVTPSEDAVVMVSGEVVAEAVRHVDPLSVEYWYELIAAPPFEPGIKLAKRYLSPLTTSKFVGAEGVVAGVPATSADAEPLPTKLIARTCTLYVVPFVRFVVPFVDNLVMVIGEVVPPESVRGYHVAPRSVEYS